MNNQELFQTRERYTPRKFNIYLLIHISVTYCISIEVFDKFSKIFGLKMNKSWTCEIARTGALKGVRVALCSM